VKLSRLACSLLFSASAVLYAEVEGVAEFKATVAMKQGQNVPSTGKVFVSKSAVRVEWETDLSSLKEARKDQTKGMRDRFRMVMLQRLAEPNKTYSIDDEQKTYSVITHEEKAQPSDRKWKVEKTGRDSVAGYSCEKAVLTSDSGGRTEVCVSKEIMPSSSWLAAWNRREDQRSPLKALREAGVEGFPIRWIIRDKEGDATTQMELVRFEKKSLPASLFEIPPGYQQTSGSMMGISADQRKQMDAAKKSAYASMTPEQRKKAAEQIRQNLENMPPEQRKQMEEMLRELENQD
jgi:uncharacterized protein DUF4412